MTLEDAERLADLTMKSQSLRAELKLIHPNDVRFSVVSNAQIKVAAAARDFIKQLSTER